jgi:hypothetical protein
MGFLFGRAKNNGPTVASGLALQSSVYGNPIPIVYGTTRVAPNLIWTGDFVATPVSAGKGGKGTIVGGGGKSGGGQFTYQTAVAMALCEGPISGVRNIYVDKSVTNAAALGFTQFRGDYPQAPWGYLISKNPAVTESHVVNGSAKATVNDSAYFYQDGGVVAYSSQTYTRTSGAPSSGHYSITIVSTPQVNSGYSALYTFNAAQASSNVQISMGNNYSGFVLALNEVIPASAPHTISIPFGDGATEGITEGNFYDAGIAGIGTPLTYTAGSPTIGEYTYSPGGVYTFNSSRIGNTVVITYYTFTGTEALGYNGIAYLAAASYQLGESAALPNHNMEVVGIFAGSTPQEAYGESDVISAVAYTNAQGVQLQAGQVVVEFASTYLENQGVTDIEGNPFTLVGSNPGYYEYTINGFGTYYFSPSNYGTEVNISYTSSTGWDADPSLVVADMLTNEHYGAAFPSQYVGDMSVYQAYCIASGLLISMCLNQQQQTSQPLQDIATATNSAWVWSNGTLQLIPYGDTNVSAFGYTYTAPITPVTSLDDDDFMRNSNPIGISAVAMNDNPVLMSRKRPADQINSIKLQVLDRANNYNVAVVEVKDQALIEQFKLRQSPASNSTLFCNLAAAQQSAQLQLQRQYIRNVYSFQLDQRYIFLDPMDIVALNDSTMGISDLLVRVLEIQENDDSTLSFRCEEYLQGTGTAAKISFQSGTGYAPDYNADPGNVNIPVIFEPTDALAGELAVWMAVSGQNTALWGGCDVYLSTDGNSYANIGRIKGPARQGVLTAPLPDVTVSATGQTIDQTNILAVNLAESAGQLISGSQSDATNLNTICYCDGELLAYENANLAGTNEYDLTFLVRGAYDSDIGAHAAGAQFARLDTAIFQYPYAAPLIGTTVLIKFLSFNIYGGGEQQLSDVQPYTYTVQGTAYTSPLPDVTGLAPAYTGYVAGTTQIIWDAVSDFRTPIDYEVRQGTTWSNGNVLYRTPLTQGPISGDGTYWVAAHFKVPNGGPDVYSETPTSLTIVDSQVTQNPIITYNASGFSNWGSTGWPGTFLNTAVTSLGLTLNAAGNILTDPDYLNTPNVLYYGGVVSSGSYQFQYGAFLAEPETVQIIINMGTEVGYSLNAVNILALMDYLNAQNILGVDLGNNTSVTPQIIISEDGITYGPWQNWIPGSYYGKAFGFRVILETADPDVLPVLSDITMIVDVPNLVQTGTDVSIGPGVTSIIFPFKYNAGPGGTVTPSAGPAVPNIQPSIVGASPGDQILLTSKSLTGFDIQVVNGGVGVARVLDWVSQGC